MEELIIEMRKYYVSELIDAFRATLGVLGSTFIHDKGISCLFYPRQKFAQWATKPSDFQGK